MIVMVSPQNLERKVGMAIKNVCAEMIKLRSNTKRILGITMCMSEQFGRGLMDEIKTIQDSVF